MINISNWDTTFSSSYLAALARNGSMRSDLAKIMAATVNQELERKFPQLYLERGSDEASVEGLRQDGTTRLGALLNATQIEEIRDYFSDKLLYPGHIASHSDSNSALGYEQVRNDFHNASYGLSDILNAPHLLELANSDRVLSIAADYLGCVPSIYSMNCWWSFSGIDEGQAIAQRYHRDPDDVLFCSLFIYLTDVDSENGPHVYIKKTHDLDGLRKILMGRISASETEEFMESSLFRDGNVADLEGKTADLFNDEIVEYTAEAGQAFIEDTYGLHKGMPLVSGNRLVFWARYGYRKTLSYVFDNTQPARFDISDRLGDKPLYQFTNRLIASS